MTCIEFPLHFWLLLKHETLWLDGGWMYNQFSWFFFCLHILCAPISCYHIPDIALYWTLSCNYNSSDLSGHGLGTSEFVLWYLAHRHWQWILRVLSGQVEASPLSVVPLYPMYVQFDWELYNLEATSGLLDSLSTFLSHSCMVFVLC